MNYYQCIQLLPDKESNIAFIRNTLMTKLHKALFDLKSTKIGVSFPQMGDKLGQVVRLHGSQDKLQNLQSLNWLGGLSGYCNISEIRHIPEQVMYRTVSRVQSKMSKSKLKRLIDRNSITEQGIKAYKAKMYSHSLDNPYLELFSNTRKKLYRRYIQHGELKNSPVIGKFDQFGLSKNATIPWF